MTLLFVSGAQQHGVCASSIPRSPPSIVVTLFPITDGEISDYTRPAPEAAVRSAGTHSPGATPAGAVAG